MDFFNLFIKVDMICLANVPKYISQLA